MSGSTRLTVAAMACLASAVCYFSIPLAPLAEAPAAILWGSAALGLAIPGSAVLSRSPGLALRAGACVALALIVAIYCEVRSRPLEAIDRSWPDRAVELEGWIEDILPGRGQRVRLILRLSPSARCPEDHCRVRVLADPGAAGRGDLVRLRAVIQSPRRAAVPGGYDFAFNAYFKRILGSGYAVTAVEQRVDLEPVSAERRLARLRDRVAARIRAQLGGRNGHIAAALLTGDRSGLDEASQASLRAAGLGHVLAISGLHMALFAGSVFLAVRILLAGLHRLRDPARPAALIAILAGTGYFLISGGSIPTQRALIMAIVALAAVIIRRRAMSMHTLAIALLAVMVVQPYSVVTPGFQMSFAAAAALVSVYGWWRRRRAQRGNHAPVHPFVAGVAGLGTTSLVAGFATGVFSAFHFHRIASFGLAGNLLAMPVFTFLVMPAGLAALLLMPFGLEGIALHAMGWGLDLVMAIADRVAELPGALRQVASVPSWVLGLYTSGFVLLLVMETPVARRLGAGLAVAALMSWPLLPAPDLLVTEQGVLIGRFEPDAEWASSSRRRDRFAQRVFLERRAVAQPRPERAPLDCDPIGCSGLAGGLQVSLVERADQWAEDCARAGLIILVADLPPWSRADCAAEVITRDQLEARGSVLLWLRDGQIGRRRWVISEGGGRRWHQFAD